MDVVGIITPQTVHINARYDIRTVLLDSATNKIWLRLQCVFFSLKFKDPCSSYSLIFGQYQRSSNYTIQSTDIAFSDNFLSEGWYRFNSRAGNDIVTWAPSIYQCGTIYPVWMQGKHQNNFEVLDMKVHICTVYL